MPRHPPCALKNLTTKMLASTVQFSNNKPKTTHTRQHQHPSPPPSGKHGPVYRHARPGRNTETPTPTHPHQPSTPQPGSNQTSTDRQMRGLLFQDPTVYQRVVSHQSFTFPPNPHHQPRKAGNKEELYQQTPQHSTTRKVSVHQ